MSPRKGKRKQPKDWTAIQAEYVLGLVGSLRELSERHRVDLNALTARAAREGWPAQRQEHVALVISQARQQTVGELADVGVAAFRELVDQLAQVRRAALAALVKDLQTPPEELKKSDEVVSKVKRDELAGETTTVTVRRRRALGDYRMAEVVLKNEIDLWRTFFGLGHAPADSGPAAPASDDGPTITIS